jgi:hypothetical protein
MAGFDDGVQQDAPGLDAGELIAGHVGNTDGFTTFEDGLKVGRFAKYDAGSLDNLDSSATPVLAGIVKRNLTGDLNKVVYDTEDDIAELINFGYVTVDVVTGRTPTKYEQVYTINASGAEAGKATDDNTKLEVPGAIFWKEIKTDVWEVRIMMGVESTITAIAASSFDVTAVDNTDGTATLTLQAKAIDGTELAENILSRVWVGGADDFGVDAITGITITTGTSKEIVTANGEFLVITDATGEAVLTLNNGGAGSIYAWAEIAGNIYPSGEIVITSV